MTLQTKAKTRIHQVAYTLAEVMITVLLVSVMLIALYAGFSSGFTVAQVTRENLRATQLMMQWTETLRLYTWPQAQSTLYVPNSFTDRYDPTSSATNAGALYNVFITRKTPSGLPAGYRSNMLEFTITVYWTNYNGKKPLMRMRQMQTYIAQHGLQNYVYPGK